MKENNQDTLVQKIKECFNSIPQEVYSDAFKKSSMVFLSGSTGWGNKGKITARILKY